MTRNELMITPLAEMNAEQVDLVVRCQRMANEKPSAPEQRVLDLMSAGDIDVYQMGSALAGSRYNLVSEDVDTRTTESVLNRLAMRGLIEGTVQQHADGSYYIHADCCTYRGGILEAPAQTVDELTVAKWLAM